MMYLFPSGDSFSIVYDGTTLTDEQKINAIVLESLPAGEGVLKRNDDGEFYYEPFEVVKEPADPTEPQPTLEELLAERDRQIAEIKAKQLATEQVVTESTLAQQELLELLIDMGVL